MRSFDATAIRTSWKKCCNDDNEAYRQWLQCLSKHSFGWRWKKFIKVLVGPAMLGLIDLIRVFKTRACKRLKLKPFISANQKRQKFHKPCEKTFIFNYFYMYLFWTSNVFIFEFFFVGVNRFQIKSRQKRTEIDGYQWTFTMNASPPPPPTLHLDNIKFDRLGSIKNNRLKSHHLSAQVLICGKIIFTVQSLDIHAVIFSIHARKWVSHLNSAWNPSTWRDLKQMRGMVVHGNVFLIIMWPGEHQNIMANIFAGYIKFRVIVLTLLNASTSEVYPKSRSDYQATDKRFLFT